MSFKNIISSNQSDFKARSSGSCWGISFIFCMRALKHGAIAGLKSMLKEAGDVEKEAEEMMKRQGKILAKAKPGYILNQKNEPETDLSTSAGFKNQNLAIQTRHNAVKQEVSQQQQKCIGTLSSFFEGGTMQLLEHVLTLMSEAGKAAAQIGLQGQGAHSVALFWDGKYLFFFDPNGGLYLATNIKSAVKWLENRFSTYHFIYAHLYI
jgi:hypothetical protein